MVAPLNDNVEALLSMSPPRDKVDVQRFLGTANYYAWMMPKFGE